MKVLILSSVYGFLVFDESNQLKDKLFHELSPKELANHYLDLKRGEKIDELYEETL